MRVTECGEPLVDLSRYGFMCMPRAGSPSPHARREVAERLGRIQERELAPRGYRWMILNAWRSRESLTEAYIEHWSRLAADQPQLDTQGLRAKIEQFAETPDRDGLTPALSTGGAIDVGLWDLLANKPADLGAVPDETSPKAALRWFESSDEQPEIRERRRLIADCLAHAGFVGAPDRVWHWEFGTPRWAQVTGALHARYGEVITMLESPSDNAVMVGAAYAADEAAGQRAGRIGSLNCRLELLRSRTTRSSETAGSLGWAGLSLGLRPAL